VLLLAALLAVPELHAQPGKENAEFKLAVNLYNDAMYDLAAEQLKSFIASYPGTAQGIEARFYLGQTQMKLKKYDDARVTFQNFALSYVEHPKAPEAWLNVGEAFHALGNDREAASAYERVKVFHPKSDAAPDALLKAAQLYRSAGERESARKALRSILQDYPSSKSVLPARLMIGELYAEEGQTDLALREARRVSESDAPVSVRASALFSIGKIQSSVSLLDDAESTFRSIPTLYPGTSVAPLSLLELGILEARAGRHAQAAEHFRTVAANEKLDDSTRADASLRLGLSLAAQRDLAGAIKAFAQSAAAGKGSGSAIAALLRASDAAASSGQWDKSLASAREVLALPASPATRRALMFAARADASLRRFDEAAQFYRSFLASFPGDAFADEVLYRLGRLNQDGRNDYRNAIAAYDQLLQEHPQSALAADAAFATADAQLALGDADGALKTYLDIQKRYPASRRSSELDSLMDAARRRSAGRRDEALRKLTRLIGEVLLEQSKPELAFQLGLIYLNDLGDEAAAADQFGAALSAGIAGDHRADASFYRARAAGLQSAADSSQRTRAIGFYDDYLKEFPSGARAEEAFYERTRLSAGSLRGAERIAALREFLARYPSSAHAGTVQLALGAAFLSAGQPADALPPLLSAVAHPGSPADRSEALALAGRAYQQTGKADSAAAVWQQIADSPYRDRHTVDALMDLARTRMEKRAFDAAAPLLARVLAEFFYTPASAEAERLLAECALQSGDPDGAVARYRALVDRDTNSPFDLRDDSTLLVLLAAAEEKKGDRQEAAALYHRTIAATNDPSVTSKALYALGSLTQAAGNKDRASAYFKQAAALGGSGSASPEIAELLFQTEQYAEAAKQFTQLAAQADSATAKREYRAKAVIATLRMDKIQEAQAMAAEFEKNFGKQKAAQADFAYEKGLSYYRKQDYTSARKAFKDVADDFSETPRGPWGEYYLGKIFEVSGALDEAAKAYTKILEKHPDSDVAPRVHLSLGNMHFNAERFEDAIRHYQAITAQPELAADVLSYAMNNLIEAYESTKLYDNALRTARDYIERYPNDENIIDKKIKIGTLYTKTGYYDQAILHFQGILDEAGSLLEAEIRYDIGEAYYYKGDYQQAILEFLKVPYLVAKQGKVDWTATSFYMAGQSYEKMSRFDDAIGMYQQIVDRPGIDATFKTAARKEIDRVKLLTKKGSK
jgi:TolA-binding protein